MSTYNFVSVYSIVNPYIRKHANVKHVKNVDKSSEFCQIKTRNTLSTWNVSHKSSVFVETQICLRVAFVYLIIVSIESYSAVRSDFVDNIFYWKALSSGPVRFCGQPIAVVLAGNTRKISDTSLLCYEHPSVLPKGYSHLH